MADRQPRTPTIGYITPQIYRSYFRLLLAGVQRAAQERGARLMVFQMGAADIVASQVGAGRVDGWVACFSDMHTAGLADLARSGRPLVTLSLPVPGAPVVITDNASGMRDVVAHLIGLGHRRIAFVGWRGNPDMPARHDGYLAAHEAAGLEADPHLTFVLDAGWPAQGEAFAEQLIAAGLPCTAVAFAGDNLALGALRRLQRAGVPVPERIAVTGFDDQPEAQIATPPLTTVRMRFDAMSRVAAEHLLDVLAGAPPAAAPITVPMSLVVRRSAGERPAKLEPRGAGSPAGPGGLAARLAETVGAPERLAPGEPPSRLWPGVESVIRVVDSAVGGGEPPPDADVQRAWTAAIAATSYADPLEDAVRQVEAALGAALQARPEDEAARSRAAGALHQLRTMLLRASVGGQVERINRSEAALNLSNLAAGALAESDLEQACGLAWLAGSDVSAAALGLWEGGEPGGALRVAGRLPGGPGPASVPASSFPPPAVGADDSRLPTLVLPLRTARRDIGFLSLAFPESLETPAFDSAPLVAALLTARIDSTTLQRERESQQADLRTAFDRERALADTVRELGCPVIPIDATTLLAPLIGVIDSQRAEQIIGTMLQAAQERRAEVVLLDVSGVPLIDTHVAGLLVRLTQMLRLLGARAAMVGVRPEIAQSMVSLGVDLADLRCFSSLTAAMQGMRARELR